MAVTACNNFDKRLTELYAGKVTVNLDNNNSSLSPDEFWKSMHLIANNNKIYMNLQKK